MHGKCWEAWITGKQLLKRAVYSNFVVENSCWWCITCIHIGCSFSWLQERVKRDNRRGDKMRVFGTPWLSFLYVLCVALSTLIHASDPCRQLTSSLPLTSSLRTRDHDDLLPSKSRGGVSCWEDWSSAGRPGRQTSSTLESAGKCFLFS